MRHYGKIPDEEVCYRCGDKAAKREKRSNGVDTGKYVCESCYRLKCKYGTYEKPKRYYNDGNRCEFVETDDKRCDEQLGPKNARRFEINGKHVWFCKRHGNKYYQRHNSNSQNNMRKTLANCRTNNEDPNHPSTKGGKDIDLVCELYNYVNLNKKYDNYRTPIDCQDPITGLLYQIQGRCYSSEDRYWGFSPLEAEWYKEYEDMICFCKSKDGKTVERMYRFPSWQIIGKQAITIYDNKYEHWYDEYRVCEEDVKKANDILERRR